MKLNIFDWIIILLTIICIAGICYTARALSQPDTITDTIISTDTITDWQADTVYLNRFDTVLLPIVYTDTMLKIDSVLVQIPIENYIFDTILKDSVTETSIKAQISGFCVGLDSLYINTKIMQQQPSLGPSRGSIWSNLTPAIGVGYGTGGFGFFIGVGYKLK